MIVAKGQNNTCIYYNDQIVFIYFLQQHKVRRTISDSCCHDNKYSVYKWL